MGLTAQLQAVLLLRRSEVVRRKLYVRSWPIAGLNLYLPWNLESAVDLNSEVTGGARGAGRRRGARRIEATPRRRQPEAARRLVLV